MGCFSLLEIWKIFNFLEKTEMQQLKKRILIYFAEFGYY